MNRIHHLDPRAVCLHGSAMVHGMRGGHALLAEPVSDLPTRKNLSPRALGRMKGSNKNRVPADSTRKQECPKQVSFIAPPTKHICQPHAKRGSLRTLHTQGMISAKGLPAKPRRHGGFGKDQGVAMKTYSSAFSAPPRESLTGPILHKTNPPTKFSS